ncbi:DUF86 domain-containing protein [Flexistipes sinusarabici]|uniref:HepT-like ribonuclease domain-containing protein n=1 Tax=Flexistipes sinusarabici TaxID=2352 RepID=UPI0026F33894|nr:HepT-like ribonuclease domain-containing protein [Flexistipes sinusarabici]
MEYYTKDFNNAQSLKHDFKSWDAVIREFEIIDEATNHLIKLNYFSNEKREIVDFKNILIHEYFGIDEDEVWGIIQNFLKNYKSDIESGIRNINSDIKKGIIKQIMEENKHIDFVVNKLQELGDE